jgi:hypothetical protein
MPVTLHFCSNNWRNQMLKTTIIAVLALSMLASAAHAKNVKRSILPPPEFDHPYVGKIKVIRDSAWSLPCRPRSLSSRLGCAYPPDETDEECVIYLAERGEIEEAGYTENAVWRHEIAHCNGWKHYRTLSGDPQFDKQLDKQWEKERKKAEKENLHKVPSPQPDQGYRPRWD